MIGVKRAEINGILVEGLNFAGKSTVCRALVARYEQRGVRVDGRHCYITDSPATAELQRLAKQSVVYSPGRPFPDADLLCPFNVYKSSQMLVDSAYAIGCPYAIGGGLMLVQDRHWLTQFGSNEFFTPGEGYLGEEWRTFSAPRFTVQMYLTCSPQERVRRSGDRRGDEHGLNSYYREHLDRLALLDEACLSLIKDDPSWIVVSTDGTTAEETADRLAAAYDALAPTATR
jgi:thymidylate kinase